MKKMYFLALFVFGAILFVGCSDVSSDDVTIEVTDMVGDVVTLKQNPNNVAVIARAASDMMVGFGLHENIDGMFETVLDNKWTNFLYPKVEEYYKYGYKESAELFLSRGVDLVLAPEQYIAESLRANGVTAITVSLYGTPRYSNEMYTLAELIGQIWPAKESLVNEWKEDVEKAISDVTRGLKDRELEEKTIHYVRGDKNRGIGYTDTIGSLVETIYEDIFGLTYLGSTFENNRPSIEDIMAKNPDIIVVGGGFQNEIIEGIKETEPQNLLDAVINNNMYNIPNGFVMWEQNSLALSLFIYDQANKLYPEYFDYDISKLTRENYKKYYNIELTDEEVSYMLEGIGPDGKNMTS